MGTICALHAGDFTHGRRFAANALGDQTRSVDSHGFTPPSKCSHTKYSPCTVQGKASRRSTQPTRIAGQMARFFCHVQLDRRRSAILIVIISARCPTGITRMRLQLREVSMTFPPKQVRVNGRRQTSNWRFDHHILFVVNHIFLIQRLNMRTTDVKTRRILRPFSRTASLRYDYAGAAC